MLVKPIFETIKYVFNLIKTSRKTQIILLSIVALCYIYNLFFRYEYKVYNIPKSYRVKVIKIDKFTHRCRLVILCPNTKYKDNTIDWDELELNEE